MLGADKEKIITTAISTIKVLIPLASAIAEAAQEAWVAYSPQDVFDLKALADVYKEHCAGENLLAPITFDPSFANHAEEKGADKDPALPTYFQFNNNKQRPFLYDEIKGHRYMPCKDSHTWIRRIRPGHLFRSIAEAIGYVCETQRERDANPKEGAYIYDPTNLFCEELKAWLLQLSAAPLGDKQIIAKIQARIDYLEAVRTRAVLFKKPSKLAAIGGKSKHVNTVRTLIVHVKKILEKQLLPVAEEAHAHRSAREHFDQLRLTIQLSIRELVGFLFYIFQDAKVSPNFLLNELDEPSFASYKTLHSSATVFQAVLRHLVCSNAFLLAFPHSTSPLNSNSLSLLPHNACVAQSFTTDFRDEQGLATLPKFNIPTLKGIQLSDCEPQVAKKKKINLGVVPIFERGVNEEIADIEPALALCAHIQMLCFCYTLSNEFFEVAGEGGNLVTYRVAAKKLSPLLEKFQSIFSEGLALTTQIKQSADQYYDRYLSPDGKKEVDSPPEWAVAWAEQNYKIANDSYKQYASHQRTLQSNLLAMQQKIKEMSSPKYDQYLANKLSKLEHFIHSFCKFHPDLARTIKPVVEIKEETPEAQQTPLAPRLGYGAQPAPQLMFAASARKGKTLCPQEILDDTATMIDGGAVGDAIAIYEALNEEYEDVRLKIRYAEALLAGNVHHRYQALGIIEPICTDNPGNLTALYLKANILGRLGEFKTALEQLDMLMTQLSTIHVSNKQNGTSTPLYQKRLMEDAMHLKMRISEQLSAATYDSAVVSRASAS